MELNVAGPKEEKKKKWEINKAPLLVTMDATL